MAVALSMRDRAKGHDEAMASPILLADALGWTLTDAGNLSCSPSRRYELENGIVAVAHHRDPALLETRFAHRLCEGELLRAGLPCGCRDAWLLLEEVFLPAGEMASLSLEDASKRLAWAPRSLLEAFAARHASHDRPRSRSWPAMAAVLPLRRIG